MADPLRHHHKVAHTNSTFGDDRFGQIAEAFARSFGTARFIVIQTVIVAIWIAANAYLIPRLLHGNAFDAYPFVFLNLLFSTQAAYAAPLILLAQTRQAKRDQAHTEAAAHHAEEIAAAHAEAIAANTALTEHVRGLVTEMHGLTTKKSA